MCIQLITASNDVSTRKVKHLNWIHFIFIDSLFEQANNITINRENTTMSRHKLSNKLRAARLGLGLTLRQLSKKTNHKVSNPYISELERGLKIKPSCEKLHYLARALKLSYIELLNDAGYVTAKDLKDGL